MSSSKLILDYVLDHAQSRPEHIWLTQPLGNGEIADFTWREVLDHALRVAAHISALNLPKGARIAILSKNCAHTMIAELAIWLSGGITVSIFPTETADTVRFVLTHSEASLLFVGKLDSWHEQQVGVPANLPCVAFPLAPTTEFVTWDALIEKNEPLANPAQPNAADIAMFIYTSGSTGQPKGVMHSFGAITRAAEGIAANVRAGIGPNTPIRMLSYLPLAHVVERAWIQCTAMVHGDCALFFSESLDTFLTDLRRARPTVFVSVPRLWLKFQQGVLQKMPERKLDFLLRVPVLGKIIGRKVLHGLGLDHVRMAGSGSAPISASLIQWYRKLGLNLLEGYGMSEDFAYSNSSTVEKNAPGYVGTALSGVAVRISGDGEIMIKSPGQFVGYYKQPELFANSFDQDGFFGTGDLGELRADGLLKITGRKKELFKTGKGKYVAPAPIENLLHACPILEASIVSGVGQQAPFGLVVITPETRAKLGEGDTREQIKQTLTALLDEVNNKLADYEQLRMIVIAAEPWSIANGCLTPTLKIKRSRIEALIEPKLASWYGQSGKVIWE
jgi:long-chain acyl-CoA synthetase